MLGFIHVERDRFGQQIERARDFDYGPPLLSCRTASSSLSPSSGLLSFHVAPSVQVKAFALRASEEAVEGKLPNGSQNLLIMYLQRRITSSLGAVSFFREDPHHKCGLSAAEEGDEVTMMMIMAR